MKSRRQISREETNSLLIYEGDVIHHFKATDLSYMMIAITFISYFISSFQRPIKPPEKLGTPKENPNLERREKNEAIICSNCLPHHKRASSFVNTYKAA
jgi:Na+-transporting methylmalonyl-CoA/oxaloacetate decarboxylase gamma subunit